LAKYKAADRGKSVTSSKKAKQKISSKDSINRAEQLKKVTAAVSKIFLPLMLIIVSLLLLISPFYRGLFFPLELLVANMIIFGLLFIWGLFRFVKSDSRFIGSPLDICLLLLLLSYLISFLGFAVNKREALEELLKIASYLSVYLVVLDICRHWSFRFPWTRGGNDSTATFKENEKLPPGLNLVLHIILVAATVITVASLGVAAGHWDFIGAYAANRIASPMGYANTAAAYLMAAYFLTLALAPLARKMLKIVYLVPAVLMLITVILTFSRGAWLLLPPLAVLMVFASPPGNRLRAVLYMAASIIPALPVAFWIDPIFRSDTPAMAWLPIMLALVAALFLGLAAEYILSLEGRHKKAIFVVFTAVIVVVLVVFVIVPLLAPTSLETKSGEPEQLQSLKQMINNIRPEEQYQLILDVKADIDLNRESGPPDYVWGVQVLGEIPGYRNLELLKHHGQSTSGWDTFTFDLETGPQTDRLSVEVFNRYPGTMVAVRSVQLISVDSSRRLNFTWSRILPDRFYDRIFSLSRDRNMDRRFELFSDAVKVIKDYPLFGLGGGGWAAVYKSYQDQPYDSREVHNHYLQVWIEAGIIGFLAFVGIWVSFTLAFLKKCFIMKAPPSRWHYWTAVFMPVAALGAHSAIDWNFSMAAVGIFLFALLGAGRSLYFNDKQDISVNEINEGAFRSLLPGLLGVVFGLSLFTYTLILYNGLQTTWRSQELFEGGNIKQALTEIEKAIALDPYRAENYHNYNVLIEGQAVRMQSQSELNKMLDLAERAYELEPYNPNYLARYGTMLLNYVDTREGLNYIDRLMDLRPHYLSGYQQPAWSRLSLIEYYVQNDLPGPAMEYYKELYDIETKMQSNYGNARSIAYVIGRAAYLNGDNNEALKYLERVGEGDPNFSEAQEMIASITGAGE